MFGSAKAIAISLAVLGVVSTLGVGGYKLWKAVEEIGRKDQQIDSLVSERQDQAALINQLREEAKARERIAKRHTQAVVKLNSELADAQARLERIKHESKDACLNAPVPAAVLDILRDNAQGRSTQDGVSVPDGS